MSSHRPHEPELLTITVARRAGGGFILTAPLCPGWAVPARTPAELAAMVEQAWAEAAIAAYARLRGVLYDLAETEECIPAGAYPAGREHPAEAPDEVGRARRRRRQRGTHDPELWVELPDGAWLSPKGHRYGPQTLTACRVRQARAGC